MKSTIKEFLVDLKMDRFNLPPVSTALVIGNKAPVGSKAVFKALNDMTPNIFERIEIEHQVIEAIIIKKSILRKIPEKKIFSLIIEECKNIMNEDDSLHIDINLTVHVKKIL